MRVFLPLTGTGLRDLLAAGADATVPADVGYAVTPSLREWYVEGDQEELEYAATLAAARASLRLVAGRPAEGSARRIVLAVEVADGDARPDLSLDRAAVRLAAPVPVSAVVSAHVDDAAAEPDVRRAVAALPAADSGDEDARWVVDAVEDHELAWYAAQELDSLLPGG